MTNPDAKARIFRFRDHAWSFPGRPLVMGILNVTPDSFSDGGRFISPRRALMQARDMIAEGADLIDVGGESTRPGAPEIAVVDELQRVLPVIRALAAEYPMIPLSIDTRKAAVATAALEAGADIVNDVSGLHHDPAMLEVLRDSAAGAVVMHMRGNPRNMQALTDYQNFSGDIMDYFRRILERAADAGVADDRFILDPGIGFSKTLAQNLQLFNLLPELSRLGRPLLVGPSRKSFIGAILGQQRPTERAWGTAGAVAAAVLRGADLVRVHDVGAMREAALVAAAIRDAGGEWSETNDCMGTGSSDKA